MELLSFDKKRGRRTYKDRSCLPSCCATARIFAGSIVVDSGSSPAFESQGFYGHEFGQRQDRILSTVFAQQKGETVDNEAETRFTTHPWAGKHPQIGHIRLSPEEAAYLAIEHDVLKISDGNCWLTKDELWKFLKTTSSVEKIAVYMNLRRLGWVVRPGHFLGCHYVIYKDGPTTYHASAGVRISVEDESVQDWTALSRALYNVKKALVTARVTFPSKLDTSSPDCLSHVDVQLTTFTTFFPDSIHQK